jgi:hypothetical protein
MDENMVHLTREEYELILRKAQKYDEIGKKGNEWQKQNRERMTEQRREYKKNYNREYHQKKKAEKLSSQLVS